MDRRSFFLGSVAGLAGLTQIRRAADAERASAALRPYVSLDVRIACVEVSDALQSGIDFGLQEAQHAARLFGASVSVRAFTEDGAGAAAAVEALIADGRTIVLSGGVPAGLLEAAAGGRILVLNGGEPNVCEPFVFHLTGRRGKTEAVWHDALERYGAAQLNARYEAARGKKMDSDAWLGWMAVKVAWESSVRAQSSDPRVLAGYLTRNTSVFDGHKGEPLRFDAETRVLEQPYYRVIDVGDVQVVTRPAKGACDT